MLCTNEYYKKKPLLFYFTLNSYKIIQQVSKLKPRLYFSQIKATSQEKVINSNDPKKDNFNLSFNLLKIKKQKINQNHIHLWILTRFNFSLSLLYLTEWHDSYENVINVFPSAGDDKTVALFWSVIKRRHKERMTKGTGSIERKNHDRNKDWANR